MTVKTFALPDLGEGLTESELVAWRVDVGDLVELNQIIAEVETAKALVELPSPFAGEIGRLYVDPGATVRVGAPIVDFEVADAGGGAEAQAAPTPAGVEREPVLVGYGPPVEGGNRPQRKARPSLAHHAGPAGGDAAVSAAITSPEPRQDVEPGAATAEPRRSTPPVRKLAHDLGVACGLAFSPDGMLFVGDRSGTIFKVDDRGQAVTFASLPPSVAAFHLAFGRDGALHVTGPTLSSYDALYRIAADGTVTTREARFGRPQGLAFDPAGALFVVEALAGASGLYRVPASGAPELVLSGPGLVGVAFDAAGTMVVAANDTAYRLTRI